MKIALAHHWLLRPRGGERVLARLAAMFPNAPILTTVVDRGAAWPATMAATLGRVRASPLQWMRPSGERLLPYLVPLMPPTLRAFTRTLRGYDTLLVSDAGLAKCIPVPPGTRKLVYVHTPMRRLWQPDEELGAEFPSWLSSLARAAARRVRAIDREAARGVDGWAANSQTTRARLALVYGIDPEKIRVVSPMVRYKRDDLAVIAATRLGIPLAVVGDGPERRRLMQIAGPTVTFPGHLDDERLCELYARSEALVFCAHEDFGLVPVEAMAAGCPVLAYRAGGATETVIEGVGGVFFDEQSPESVANGIQHILARRWDRSSVRASVERFSVAAFERGIEAWVGTGGGAGGP